MLLYELGDGSQAYIGLALLERLEAASSGY
jgi:hypothetical protein